MTGQELSSLAYRIAGDMCRRGRLSPQMVEDAAQAGLVAAMGALKRYDGAMGAALSTYVGIRIRGAVLDEVNRQMRSCAETSYDELEVIDQAPGHTETPERHAMHYERLMRLVAAINRLPARSRRLLVARYSEERGINSIGLEFGVSEARVSQLHKNIVLSLRETCQ